MQTEISIIIPNYNGRKLLEKNLTSVLAAARNFGRAEVIVVDDFSADDSRAWLAENYAGKIKIVLPEKNLGFSGAIMAGVQAADSDIVYFLNSDIRVEADFLDNLPAHFKDEKVFAVSSLAYDGPGAKVAAARAGIVWKWGMPDVDRDVKNIPSGLRRGPTLFASGGHAAYRKNLFIELGGFNHLFKPFYYEDVDLCYSAWKRGYKILFEPSSVVYHDHQGTIASVAKKKDIEITLRCNRLLFTWKNITSKKLIIRHALLLPTYMALAPLSGARGGAAAFQRALSRRSEATKLKKAASSAETISDELITAVLSEDMPKPPITVCYFGSFNLAYPRVELNVEGLLKRNIGVKYCHVPAGKLFKTWPRLALKFLSGCLKCDIIIVGQGRHMDAPLAKFLGTLTGKKVILDAFVSHYNTVVEDYQNCAPGSKLAKLNEFYDKVGVAFSNHVLMDTDNHIDYYCEKYSMNREKFTKILVGAQERIYKPQTVQKEDDGKFIVLFCGSYLKLHGVETILRAAKILQNESDVEFHFVGDGPFVKDAEKMNSDLGLTNTVFFPTTDYAGVARYIAGCDIALGIFGATKKALMVIPNKIFNNIAVKKPLITADTPGVRELFEDGKNISLCPPENPEALADAIMKMKNDPEFADRIATRGYELFMKKCLPQHVVEPLVKVIEKLTGRRAGDDV